MLHVLLKREQGLDSALSWHSAISSATLESRMLLTNPTREAATNFGSLTMLLPLCRAPMLSFLHCCNETSKPWTWVK